MNVICRIGIFAQHQIDEAELVVADPVVGILRIDFENVQDQPFRFIGMAEIGGADRQAAARIDVVAPCEDAVVGLGLELGSAPLPVD